jgi:hypothetical protein
VVANSRSVSSESADSALGVDLVAEVAGLRARAASWEETAAAVGWDAAELRRALRHDPTFPAALDAAEEEVYREGQADGMARLRALTKDPDPDRAKEAAQIIFRFMAERRRDQTRLEVERLRAEGRRLKAARPANAGDDEDDGVQLTPEQEAKVDEAFRRDQQLKAEKLAREQAIVYLWGGCHPIGDTPPDGTDTPMAIVSDMTAFRGRMIYWVVTDPMPTHPRTGPFLPPPGCRPRTCPDPRTGYMPPDPYADTDTAPPVG